MRSYFLVTIMPDLVAALTDLANDLSLASSTVDKHNGSSTVESPGGGSLTVDLTTGRGTLTDCSVERFRHPDRYALAGHCDGQWANLLRDGC
ncbi:MAG: hypothetical protein WCE62_01095 [Polyangiales bacterium]